MYNLPKRDDRKEQREIKITNGTLEHTIPNTEVKTRFKHHKFKHHRIHKQNIIIRK